MQQSERTPEQQWLERMAGDWTWEMEAEGGPGEPPIRDSGTEFVRSLNGVWLMAESTGQVPGGGESTGILTLGFDAARGRFVGTFISSMMAHLWIYDGELDADRRVLSVYAEGPSYTEEGQMARYRDTIEFRGDDERVHTSGYGTGDGSWHPFMTVTYRRTL